MRYLSATVIWLVRDNERSSIVYRLAVVVPPKRRRIRVFRIDDGLKTLRQNLFLDGERKVLFPAIKLRPHRNSVRLTVACAT